MASLREILAGGQTAADVAGRVAMATRTADGAEQRSCLVIGVLLCVEIIRSF
jgi:hypothetical protein